MPVVYVDIVWVVNLVMDAVMLLTAGWIAKRRLKLGRVAFGGLIGSLYSLLLFVPQAQWVTTWPGKAIVSLLMVAIALVPRTWLDLARLTVLFYVVAFVFAGATLALHFAVPGVSASHGLVLTGSHLAYASSVGGLALVVAIPVSVFGLQSTVRRVRQWRVRSGLLCTMEFTYRGKQKSLIGLVDTGNQLRDPVSRRPVTLVEVSAVREVLPQALAISDQGMDDFVTALGNLSPDDARGFSVIPYRGAGGRQQMTIGFSPDEVTLLTPTGKRHVVQTRCILALCADHLSSDRSFQAIVHTELVTGVDGFHDELDRTTQREAAHPTSTVVDPHSSNHQRRI